MMGGNACESNTVLAWLGGSGVAKIGPDPDRGLSLR